MSDRRLTVVDVAQRLGVASSTVRAYAARGQMPAPDGRLGRTPWWWERTIEVWESSRRLRMTDRSTYCGHPENANP